MPDQFIEHGDHQDQLRWTGLDSKGITARINSALSELQLVAPATLEIRDTIELAHKFT